MSGHSDLVARLRNCAEAYRVHATLGVPRKFYAAALSELANVLEEAADALDVKPGANADLIAEARSLIMGVTFWAADGRTLPQKDHLIARLSAALEAADSRARVLPTREQIVVTLQRVCQGYRKNVTDPIPYGLMADDVLALLTGGKADEE